jgi:hypothetical protein
MTVVINLSSPQIAGGSGSDQIRDTGYAAPSNAVSAISNGFLPLVSPTSGQVPGEYVAVSTIRAIVPSN